MEVLTIDLETSVKCPVGNNKGHPMWLGNKVVLWDAKYLGGTRHFVLDEVAVPSLRAMMVGNMVVGQNIKFDLSYLYRDTPHDPLPPLWDTQLAEYVLSGQQLKYASLDALTHHYGGTSLKDDAVKQHWASGGDTEDIDKGVLEKYLKGDVENTEMVFKKQWERAQELDMLPLMFTQMDALRATTAMHIAGMAVDWDYVDKMKEELGHTITSTRAEIEALAPGLDPGSPKELSLHFFGGIKKEVVREHVGMYKNGNPKYKNAIYSKRVDGIYSPKEAGVTVGKSGYYPCGDATLAWIHGKGDKLASLIRELRLASKLKETYYEGLSSLRFPSDLIYPQLSHCSTHTGRLSCSAPNLQNQTDEGGVKRAFISRYPGGKLIECDYSQLEMVWLAYIADDKVLQDDINSGRDMHRELYKEMYGRYPTDAERKPFKRFSFLLVYGGGVTTLMKQSGCDRETAKRFIDTFYKRYVGVAAYHNKIVVEADREKYVYYEEGAADTRYRYEHTMPWGRRYVFRSYFVDWKGEQSLSPTELKNYMVQGSATGDMVPLIVGILQRKLEEGGYYQSDKAKMVMTVHDSILIDCRDDACYNVASLVKEVMEDAPKYLETHLGVKFPCKLTVGCSIGENWQDMNEVNPESLK